MTINRSSSKKLDHQVSQSRREQSSTKIYLTDDFATSRKRLLSTTARLTGRSSQQGHPKMIVQNELSGDQLHQLPSMASLEGSLLGLSIFPNDPFSPPRFVSSAMTDKPGPTKDLLLPAAPIVSYQAAAVDDQSLPPISALFPYLPSVAPLIQHNPPPCPSNGSDMLENHPGPSFNVLALTFDIPNYRGADVIRGKDRAGREPSIEVSPRDTSRLGGGWDWGADHDVITISAAPALPSPPPSPVSNTTHHQQLPSITTIAPLTTPFQVRPAFTVAARAIQEADDLLRRRLSSSQRAGEGDEGSAMVT
ncbi:hypothetical protein I350_06212 [Cryptococcus amylolentus CBS 6273]|uniref:Uncharacterized protein n=1 Tax=Cryptococcus amylolentus CBS 6273 TaxID=1296118 RepID=A0A1E3JKQ0_9TREE|nr:hypothetical protein I350_06212 [Cryptococcus amylolentus CBS 6273]